MFKTQEESIEKKIIKTGEEIMKRMEAIPKSSIFSKEFWYGNIMDWSMKNEKFKTQMFRFVDVLPSLTSGTEVARHLKEYFSENGGEELPPVFHMGLGMGFIAPSLLAGAIRKNITEMAKMFIAETDPKEIVPILQKTRKSQMTFTVDILGEATLSEKEALAYQAKYLEIISLLAQESNSWTGVPALDQGISGPLPKVNVSVKLTALDSQINNKAFDDTKTRLKERLRPLLHAGLTKGVFVNLDMEQYSVKHLTLEVFTELLMEKDLRHYPFFGCVIQAYLRDSYKDIQELTAFAGKRGTPFTVRLVKGAYWDYETIKSEQQNWRNPVYINKQETDANYESCIDLLLKNHPLIHSAFASHNVRTIASAITLAEKHNVPTNGFEIQMLYGMADSIKKTLVDMGFRVREYIPVGDLIPGMAYLVRRLLENTSNESWLRGKFAEGMSSEKLLRNPNLDLTTTSPLPKIKEDFYNEALLDFSIKENRDGTQKAISECLSRMPQKCPLFIDGKELESALVLSRENPSNPSQILGQISLASPKEAEKAILAAKTAWPHWKKTPVETRANLLENLADLMLKNRFNLMAKQIIEVGKPWDQADGDVTEAIDFCRYYAKDMRQLSRPQRMGSVPGEVSLYQYQPRGVTLVIAPWNFPLAILTGMVSAALVTGNTVIVKPAEQSSLIANDLALLMKEVGFPSGVAHFLPGIGEEVGEYLVDHKDIATIAFTGSRSVGLRILQKAAVAHPGQTHVKRCLIEMGGKNAIIVDNDADLDEAISEVISSAFGFAGQKCSACSRVIVLDEIYDKFIERLIEATKSLAITNPQNPIGYFGPVIDRQAYERLQNIIREAQKNHQLLYSGSVPNSGYFIPPTIFAVKDHQSSLAQEEIFGPVLAVIKAKDLDEALKIANSTAYALTGGVFSRSPMNIAKVQDSFEGGNLYINRGITGALVNRHPFGGYRLSGIGSKTGGPDYLKQFMEPKVVTENTMRRGFAPT